ncbi:MAG: hypothetical protein KUL87_09740 [Pseudomonas sp.]|nr:hypothetical protein [Pseudomonas sp.]
MKIKKGKLGSYRALLAILVAGALALSGVKYGISQSSRADDVLTIDPLLLATRSVLTAVDRAGGRLVAVGEGGIVLLSDDNGQSWRLTESGVNHTLTAVRFKDERQGIAVGHQGVVLRTTNGGETWQRASPGQGVEEMQYLPPYLEAWWSESGDAVVLGAFGEAWRSQDGGLSWTSLRERLLNDEEHHLYGMAELDGSIYFAGEFGTLLATRAAYVDGQVIDTPYPGTFFGVLATDDHRLLLYGLRGTALVSGDRGLTWSACQVPTDASLTVGLSTASGDLLLATAKGEILRAPRGSCEFSRVDAGYEGAISGLVQVGAQSVVAVGMRGVSTLLSWR